MLLKRWTKDFSRSTFSYIHAASLSSLGWKDHYRNQERIITRATTKEKKRDLRILFNYPNSRLISQPREKQVKRQLIYVSIFGILFNVWSKVPWKQIVWLKKKQLQIKPLCKKRWLGSSPKTMSCLKKRKRGDDVVKVNNTNDLFWNWQIKRKSPRPGIPMSLTFLTLFAESCDNLKTWGR